MNSYTVTIVDKDTEIQRTSTIFAETPEAAHKDAWRYEINDFDIEQIVKIVNEDNVKVFTEKDGFIETVRVNNEYEQ
jgi:hypothetical protein